MIPRITTGAVLWAAAVFMAGCSSTGAARSEHYGHFEGMLARGETGPLLTALANGAAEDLNAGERTSLFEAAWERAKVAYETIDTEPARFRDLLEVLWRLNGTDPRYAYLATTYAYVTGQHGEVVRVGPAALESGMRARVAYMLAESHAALGDRERAAGYYRLALSEDLSGFEDVRARCLARLEELR